MYQTKGWFAVAKIDTKKIESTLPVRITENLKKFWFSSFSSFLFSVFKVVISKLFKYILISLERCLHSLFKKIECSF